MTGKDMRIMFAAESTPATVAMLQNAVTKLDADIFLEIGRASCRERV